MHAEHNDSYVIIANNIYAVNKKNAALQILQLTDLEKTERTSYLLREKLLAVLITNLVKNNLYKTYNIYIYILLQQ